MRYDAIWEFGFLEELVGRDKVILKADFDSLLKREGVRLRAMLLINSRLASSDVGDMRQTKRPFHSHDVSSFSFTFQSSPRAVPSFEYQYSVYHCASGGRIRESIRYTSFRFPRVYGLEPRRARDAFLQGRALDDAVQVLVLDGSRESRRNHVPGCSDSLGST